MCVEVNLYLQRLYFCIGKFNKKKSYDILILLENKN